MLTYETLDAIADAVNPVLFGTTLILPAIPAIRARTQLVRWYVLLVFALLAVYGLMFVDGWLNLWPSFGADYSTHTALATALIALWSRLGRHFLFAGISILLPYAALMLYQGYHTVLDMFTTACVIATLSAGMMHFADRRGLRTALGAPFRPSGAKIE